MKKAFDYLQSLQFFGMKLGLENIKKLCKALGDPQEEYKKIHVAGSNGKGSTCAFLDSIIRQGGYKVGLYTSPHLVRFNERIKVNGEEINDKDLNRLILKLKKIVEENHLEATYFEFTTALAFLYFQEQKVNFAVIETGLGGRLDATNVIIPKISVITNISLEHTEHLGQTIGKVAFEKAGIIKQDTPLITSEDKKEAIDVFKKVCRKKNSKLIISKMIPKMKNKFSMKMKGKHQIINASLAIKTINKLREKKFLKISDKQIKSGIEKTYWKGRYDIISEKPKVIIDGAHNKEGIKYLREMLDKIKGEKILLCGFSEDKDLKKISKILFPGFKKIIISKGNYKPMETSLIAKEACKFCENVEEVEDVKEAYKKAIKETKKNNALIITGSLYLIGDVYKIIEKKSI
jgi:dihydrofolate synthase/folylpolyglutamate synthase